jgi:tetratricopeptide (TPR) repeat protein
MFSLTRRATIQNENSYLISALLVAALLIISTGSAGAQGGGTDSIGTGGKHTIQGRIYFPSGRTSDMRTKVKLENTSSGGLSVLADIEGAFRFTNLSSGSYTIVIEAGEEYEATRESVYIEGNSSLGRGMRMPSAPRTVMVPIYLQLKRVVNNGNRPGVFNAALASVPKSAADLYLSALDSARAGDSKKAIAQLLGAIAHYPEFALALNELGVQYLKLGQGDKAVEVLQRAVRIAPDALAPRLNYGVALLERKDFVRAEAELRQVLKRNDGAATAHLYLGITLINLRNYAEAEKELQRAVSFASSELRMAHYYLGGIYWRNKEYKRAADELEKYLQQAPNAPESERIRETIKELRSKQSK